jgi:peptide/nickel transport system substrate-binding protein
VNIGRVRHRRALALLAVTACVLGPAALAGGERSTALRRDGTVEVAFFVRPGGIDSIDPAFPGSPWRERLLRPTCAQLMTLPGPRPEVSAGYPDISADRRTYTFKIRKGLRFNTGERVTGKSFARAFERLLSPELGIVSPDDAAFYVGGREYLAGKSERIRGVVGRRNTLVVRLTRQFPELLDDLASRFFCAVPARLPVDPEGVRAPLASAGPYYVSRYVPDRLVVLTRNQRYRGPRPQHVGSYRIDLANTPTAAVEQVTSGLADLAVPFSFQYTQLAARYGRNRSRFFLFADGTVLQTLVLNTERELFRNNAKLRRAVGFAVDRRALIRVFSPYYGSPSDQFLSPGVAGFRKAEIYPPRANPERASALAKGHTRSRTAVLYVAETTEFTTQAQLVRQMLRRIGLEVEIRAFPSDVFASKISTRGEPFDMALVRHELPRASASILSCWFHGRNVPTATAPGCNLSRFDSRPFNRRLAQAERLVGQQSFERFGRLDVDLARKAAPVIPITHPARAVIVSRRVGCHRFGRPLLDLAAVCLRR